MYSSLLGFDSMLDSVQILFGFVSRFLDVESCIRGVVEARRVLVTNQVVQCRANVPSFAASSTTLRAMSWAHHFERGELSLAISALRELVKTSPTPANLALLSILLGLSGRWEDAVVGLHRAASRDPSMDGWCEEIEHWIWADRSRDLRRVDPTWKEPRRWLGEPTRTAELRAEAMRLIAHGDRKLASSLVTQGKRSALAQPGVATTRAGTQLTFDDIEDIDSLTGACFELVTDTLVDAPFANLRRVVFIEAAGLRDSLWLPVEVEPITGPKFLARVPALYAGSFRSSKPLVRVGRDQLIDEHLGVAIGGGRRELKLKSSSGAVALLRVDLVAEISFGKAAPHVEVVTPEESAWPALPPGAAPIQLARAAPPAAPGPIDEEAETWRPPPFTERSEV